MHATQVPRVPAALYARDRERMRARVARGLREALSNRLQFRGRKSAYLTSRNLNVFISLSPLTKLPRDIYGAIFSLHTRKFAYRDGEEFCFQFTSCAATPIDADRAEDTLVSSKKKGSTASSDGVDLSAARIFQRITEVFYTADTGNRANYMSRRKSIAARDDCECPLLIARSLRIIGTSEKFPRTPPVKSFVCAGFAAVESDLKKSLSRAAPR